MSNVRNYASLLVWGGSVFVSSGQEQLRSPSSFFFFTEEGRVHSSFDVRRPLHAHVLSRL